MAAGDEGINAGVVHVDVVPDTSRFGRRAKEKLEPEGAQIGRRVGERMAAGIVRAVTPAIARAVRSGGRIAAAEAGRVGRDAGAAFARNFRAEVERRKVTPKVDVDTTSANRKLDTLTRKVERLSGTRAGIAVDVDAGSAVADLTAVEGAARRVGGLNPTINVNADTGAATAQLAGIGAAAGVSAGGIHILLAAAAALAPVIVPAAAVAAAAIAAIGPAAVVGAAGIGVLALGFAGVGDAVKAMGAAERSAGKDAAQAATRQASLASASDAVANAQRSLANTRATVAEAARQAARRVADAERDLARAQDDARQIQVDLTRARQEARQALEDLDSQVRNNALAQRQGNLDVADARRELDKVLANPKASKEQIEQAKIRYEREVLQQQDLARRGKRLAAEQKAAQKAGIEGSQQVLAVRQRQAQADDRVAASARNLAEARRAQANTERQGAFQLAQAQQAVAAAQRSLAAASVTAGASGSAAMTKLREAMEGLSPAGQRFARFLHSLRPALDRIKAAAQGGLLPGVEAGIRALLPVLPQVEVFVGRVARALGGFFAAFGRAMASPFWQQFFDRMGRLAGPVFQSLATILDGLGRGFASLLLAFAPLSLQMGEGLARIAQGFADWAASLSGTQGFKDFISYVLRVGPQVMSTLGLLVAAFIHIGKALSPIGEVGLAALRGLSRLILAIPVDVLTTLIAVVLGVVVALKAFAVVMAVVNAVMALNPVGIVVIALIALGAALFAAWRHSETFRKVVKGAWDGIAVAAKATWEGVIRPILLGLRDLVVKVVAPAALWLWREVLGPAFKNIGTSATFLWEHALKPALTAIWSFITTVLAPALLWWWRNVTIPVFKAIGAVIDVWWTRVVQPVLAAVRSFVANVLAPVFMWLWRNVVSPVFTGIRVAISVAWAIIKVIFGLIQIHLKILGAAFGWLYRVAIKPAMDLIGTAISWVWRTIIKPALTAFGGFIENWVAPAFRRGVDAVKSAWDKVKEVAKVPIRFVVETVLNNGLLAGYNKLAKLFGVKPDNVRIALPAGFRDGGQVKGPGTGTSDSIAARLSHGEHVWTAKEVAGAGGHRAVEVLRRKARTGDGIGDLLRAARKKATDVITGVKDFVSDPAGTLRKLADRLVGLIPGRDSAFGQAVAGLPRKVAAILADKVRGLFTREDGVQGTPGVGGLGGSAGMMRILRGIFPGLPLFSGFRPGSITPSGNLSWHARNRAVDIPPRRDVFDFIYRNFFPGTRELIWLGAANRNIQNGRHYRYSDALLRQHGVAGMPNAHIHWAYDSGGYLPPGISTVVNRTGRPEPVLTDAQWQAMVAATRGGDGPSNNYSFTFADTTLTPARLRAMQDRDDALRRVNRPNR